jgi:hypothetical protein
VLALVRLHSCRARPDTSAAPQCTAHHHAAGGV